MHVIQYCTWPMCMDCSQWQKPSMYFITTCACNIHYYYYYICYCAEIKLIVVHRCDHKWLCRLVQNSSKVGELITFGGIVFQSLITEGKKENLYESIIVCGWLKYPSLDGRWFGEKSFDGTSKLPVNILYIVINFAIFLLYSRVGIFEDDIILVTLL